MVEAGLVAADAGVDFVGAGAGRLDHEIRIGQQRARHRHHVGTALGQHPLGYGRIVDAVGGDERDADLAHELFGHPGKAGARHRGGDGGNARFVPADAGVDQGGAGRFDGPGERDHFVPARAFIDQVEHGQAVDDDEAGTDGGTDGLDGLDGEAHAVGKRAAPFVGALVGAAAQELVDQVALGTHHLDAVIAGLLRQCGAAGEVGNGLVNIGLAERNRLEGIDRCLHGAGRHRLELVAVAAGMQDLQGDLAVGGVDGIGDDPVAGGVCFRGEHLAAGKSQPLFVGGDAAGDDQADAATGALGVKGGHTVIAVRQLFQPGMHGAHQHTVFQGGEAEIKRGEEMRIGRHGVCSVQGGARPGGSSDNIPRGWRCQTTV